MNVLIVVTSHDVLGSRGTPTGYYLPEVAHPVAALAARGIGVHFASPKGGRAPVDPKSLTLDDPALAAFWAEHEAALANTIPLAAVDPAAYDAIFFAGGHGTMWDFADDAALQSVTAAIWAKGGVVAAVCHGPAALVNVRVGEDWLVAGRKVAAFTDAEESAAGLTEVVPFLLASTLSARGAKHQAGPNWASNVVVDGRLVTGQNPASATGVGEAVARLLVA